MIEDKKDLSKRLICFFDSPISSIFLEKDVVGHILKIYFKKDNFEILSISNEMIDLAERLEEGCLVAEVGGEALGQEISFELYKKVDCNSLGFLVRGGNGNTHPSGFRFRFLEEKSENLILAGAAPFTLVFISTLYSEQKNPEYELSSYVVEAF